MNDVLAALLLGMVEGLTEFLPISSTGHLLIAQHWLGARSDFFNIVIQAGAMVSVCVALRQRLWAMATGWGHAPQRDYRCKVVAAFVVTAAVGLPVRLAGWTLPGTVTPIAWALVVGGVWMLWVERRMADESAASNVTWAVAIGVGLAQAVAALLPGLSRSAAAIFTAMLLGLGHRPSAAEFAFVVGVPTMFAASAFAFFELASEGRIASESWVEVGIAFTASAITGLLVVKWLLRYVKSRSFAPFAWYRIALGIGLLGWLPQGS